jgi:prepilin-type N-terminal cleavage/methylation domain-containing protein
MLSKRKGFTLIELLIVVVIIGILAAIAIPKFSTTKEKAYVAAMQSDLRNLVTAQEAYFADHAHTYSETTEGLGTSYKASTGVTVVISDVAVNTWTATATHTNAPDKRCTITIGTATNSGEPVCTDAVITF